MGENWRDQDFGTLAVSGSTLWHTYDDSTPFCTDAQNIAKLGAYRCGYPILQVELSDQNFYVHMEDTVDQFLQIIRMATINRYFPNLLGELKSQYDLTNQIPGINFDMASRASYWFSKQAGIGGNEPFYTSSITLVTDQPTYDLSTFSVDDKMVEVRNVYYKPMLHSNPFGTGFGLSHFYFTPMATFVGGLGFNSPMSMSRILTHKLYAKQFQTVVGENVSWVVKGQKLTLIPPPPSSLNGESLYFEYTLGPQMIDNDSTLTSSASSPGEWSGSITDISDVPFSVKTYDDLNQPSTYWIRDMTIAKCKETLGLIRGKFSEGVPIPGKNVRLNSAELLSQSKTEKDRLFTELGKVLESLGLGDIMEQLDKIAEKAKSINSKVPSMIYKM